MKFEAYFLVPFGGILVALYLSGWRPLQKIAIWIHRQRFSMGSQGQYSVNISVVAFVYSVCRLFFNVMSLRKIWERKDLLRLSGGMPGSGFDFQIRSKLRMDENRADRNFWLLSLSVFIWFVVMRFAAVLSNYFKRIEEAEKQANERRSVPVAADKTPKAAAWVKRNDAATNPTNNAFNATGEIELTELSRRHGEERTKTRKETNKGKQGKICFQHTFIDDDVVSEVEGVDCSPETSIDNGGGDESRIYSQQISFDDVVGGDKGKYELDSEAKKMEKTAEESCQSIKRRTFEAARGVVD